MYTYINGNLKRVSDVIWNYIFKTELFKKTIKQIDDKFLNTRMNCHEDFLLFFILTRNAYNLKHIKRLFYVHLYWKNYTNERIIFSKKQKMINKKNLQCLSFINYIEFLLVKTNNTIEDKKIASYELNNWYLNHSCRNNKYIKKRGINVCKLFLKNEFIEKEIKNNISLFLNKSEKYN